MKRVVITGIGAITPLGNSFPESWEALKAGRSSVKEITRFDVLDLPWRVAGELRHFDPSLYLTSKELKRLDPFIQYAVTAAHMAAEDAGILNEELGEDTGVIIGSSRGGINMIERAVRKNRPSAYLMPATTISMASSYVATKLKVRGYCLGISNACASGATALGEAYRLIRTGILKTALAGGTEAPLCRICIEGYGTSGVLSKSHSETPRPFDKRRDGFVLSEGACILVLEEFERAIKKGVKIYGEIIGYSNSNDASHITRPSLDGEVKAIKMAIADAGLNTWDVDLVSAHGTGTPIGDHIEAEALKAVFGKRGIRAMALKSMTGHMLAASGAFEVAATILSLREKIVLPTVNTADLEDGCNLRLSRKTEKADINIAISNSFGFGGVNTVLVLREFK